MEDRITCLQCHHRINESARFCESCGSKVSSPKRSDKSEVLDNLAPTQKNNNRDKLIFAGLMILCGSAIYYFVLNRIVSFTENWELYDTIEPLSLLVSAASAAVALLLALALKAGSRKTIALIFAAIYTLIHLYWFIDRLIPDEPALDFLQF